MATNATDCEHQVRQMATPEALQNFLNRPEALAETFRWSQLSRDEFTLYDEVDPKKGTGLSQEGTAVIITGAGRGIGRGTAVMFAEANARAIGICARTLSELEDTRDKILAISPGTSVYLQQVDITAESDVRSFFEAAKSEFGSIDVVVSNAGAQNEFKPIADTSTEQWWDEITVNLKGTYLVAKYFAQSLEGKTGTFVNISSTNALIAAPYQSAYCASKVAAARMVETMHLESPNIRCFNLHPGAVDTQMVRNTVQKTGFDMSWKWTDPILTGGTILWLTTPSADFLRGRWLSVNWRVDELEAKKDVIVGQNLMKSAFNAQLGI